MGYQIIEAQRVGRSSIERFLVYNCELFVVLNEKLEEHRRQIKAYGYKAVFNKARYLEIDANTIVLDIHRTKMGPHVSFEKEKKNKGRHSGGKAAIDSPVERANGKEVFARLSAYENDKRIDFKNKRLRPGSYTTTYDDYLTCLQYSDDPIDRYALPNPATIKWVFHILPTASDSLQRGIVQPNYGHDGGGIEAYFEKGTSNDTFKGKTKYGGC